jgi:hypothetical protein
VNVGTDVRLVLAYMHNLGTTKNVTNKNSPLEIPNLLADEISRDSSLDKDEL